MTTLSRGLLLVTAAGAALAASRLALRNAGASRDERRRPLPGDELIPDAGRPATMAVTIEAPPRDVWPWLVQMGTDRAGFYSWDRLDNGGRPSATEIHPEWQDLRVGDRVISHPSRRTWFVVAELVPERALVLRGTVDLTTMRPVDPPAAGACVVSDGIWAFALEPLAGNRTRLLVRASGRLRPPALKPLDLLVGDPAHFVMQRRQLRNLKERAERTLAPAAAPG